MNGALAPKSNVVDSSRSSLSMEKATFQYAAWQVRLKCFRGSYRRHEVEGLYVNKGDPLGSRRTLVGADRACNARRSP